MWWCDHDSVIVWQLENHIEFWECPSHCDWYPHKVINTETKSFRLIPMFPSKLSWDFSKKNECNDLINKWKITFQVSDLKGKHFLDLVDSNNNLLEPSYIRGGPWLQNFGHSNSLCVRASRAITNHALIGEYRLSVIRWNCEQTLVGLGLRYGQ